MMKVETERLILRKLTIKDALNLQKVGNDYEIHYNSFFLMKYPFRKKEALEVIKEKNKNLIRLGIESKKEKKIIGIFDIYNINLKEKKLKIGYWIGKNYRRNGYLTEIFEKAIPYIFENFKIEKIIATTLVSNIASINLLKKQNFKQDKYLKNDRFLDGEYIDSIQFVLEKPRV